MPPRRDPLNGAEENRNIYTEIALVNEKMTNLTEVLKSTSLDVRTLKDANFLTTRDFQALFEKLQGTFVGRREFDELDGRITKIEGYVAKVVGVVVLAVLSSLLALVLKSNGVLH
jgi:hypothetical protein